MGFNKSVDKLIFPDGLTHLTMSASFNRPFDKVRLPQHLIYLEFGDAFDQSLEKVELPSGLEEVRLGKFFSHPLTKGRRVSVLSAMTPCLQGALFKTSKFSLEGEQREKSILPERLKTLHLSKLYRHPS